MTFIGTSVGIPHMPLLKRQGPELLTLIYVHLFAFKLGVPFVHLTLLDTHSHTLTPDTPFHALTHEMTWNS